MDAAAIFRDVDNIPLGVRFDSHLENALGQCRVVLAVIGPRWMTPRLSEANDHLRLELEFALTRGIPIIPVLVGGTTLPNAAELPTSIRDLVLYQGVEVRSDRSFKGSVEFLAKGIHTELARQERVAAARAQAEHEAKARAERDALAHAERERQARVEQQTPAQVKSTLDAKIEGHQRPAERNEAAALADIPGPTLKRRRLVWFTVGGAPALLAAGILLSRSVESSPDKGAADEAEFMVKPSDTRGTTAAPDVTVEAQPVDVNVHTDVENAVLVINGENQGTISPQQTRTLKLRPGAYRFEAVTAGTTVASTVATLRGGVPLDVFLQVPTLSRSDEHEAAVETPAPKAPPPAPARARRVSAGGGAQPDAAPMQVATACLARGDNACVVRALEGKASTAQELGLLIECYRAMGESAKAYEHMQTYVQRFPTARRADSYRAMLERNR